MHTSISLFGCFHQSFICSFSVRYFEAVLDANNICFVPRVCVCVCVCVRVCVFQHLVRVNNKCMPSEHVFTIRTHHGSES